MKISRIIQILFVILLVCSCNREQSVISEYRDLAQELKTTSSDYTEEDWKTVANKFEKIEKEAQQCKFSPKEKKELNRLRGQCMAYMLKAMTKQTKHMVDDAMDQVTDIADGFNEALGEGGVENLLNNENE